MLRLNRLTDYAVVVLGHMARRPGAVRNTTAIGEATQSRVFVLMSVSKCACV